MGFSGRAYAVDRSSQYSRIRRAHLYYAVAFIYRRHSLGNRKKNVVHSEETFAAGLSGKNIR